MADIKLKKEDLTDEELASVSGGVVINPGYYIRYTIQRGDTLTKIASRYGTTVDILVQINHIADKNRIYAGATLLIPVMG